MIGNDPSEFELRHALRLAARGAPEGPVHTAQIVHAGRHRIRRRFGMLLALGATVIGAGFIGGLSIRDGRVERAGRLLPASAIPSQLTCANGVENTGTPSYAAGSQDGGMTPLQNAAAWARGSGFSRAFPAASAQEAAAANGNRVVFYSSPDGTTLALLTFAKKEGGWSLENVRSCGQ